MNYIERFIKAISHPIVTIQNQLISRGLLSDKKHIQMVWKRKMGYNLNLDAPKTYNEKLQWLKLHDHNPLYTTLVDKFAVKEYVASKIGSQYIIPTLGVWNSFDDIDFEQLPDKFVLKVTHDSGGLVICRDKKTLDQESVKLKIEKSINTDYYKQGREWPYKNVPRRIIAEQYMEDKFTGELRDYKFFCFDGVVKAMFIATDRQNRDEPYFDFFDDQFNHLPVKHGHPNAPIVPEKPLCFDEMKRLASILSKNIRHVRVDFYEVDGKVYFGEMTFYHHSGMVKFDPPNWDTIFGKWIKLTGSEYD